MLAFMKSGKIWDFHSDIFSFCKFIDLGMIQNTSSLALKEMEVSMSWVFCQLSWGKTTPFLAGTTQVLEEVQWVDKPKMDGCKKKDIVKYPWCTFFSSRDCHSHHKKEMLATRWWTLPSMYLDSHLRTFFLLHGALEVSLQLGQLWLIQIWKAWCVSCIFFLCLAHVSGTCHQTLRDSCETMSRTLNMFQNFFSSLFAQYIPWCSFRNSGLIIFLTSLNIDFRALSNQSLLYCYMVSCHSHLLPTFSHRKFFLKSVK